MENWMDKVKQRLEEYYFTIEEETEGIIRISRVSSAGQDFSFYTENGETLEELRDNILNRYENFDVSQEAYYWLDDSGHGINGAPYDMKDVYEDMEECKSFIYDAFCLVRNLVFERQNREQEEEA